MSQIVNDNSLFAPGRNPSNSLYIYEDFMGGPGGTIANNNQVGSFLRAVIAATGTIAAAAGVAEHPGINLCTITAGADNAYMQSTSSLLPGTDAITLSASVRVTAAAAADTAAIGIGLGFALPAATTARAQIVWQQSTNSWLCQVANGASVSTVAVAAALNTWYSLRIELNTSQCQFYIDGVLVATFTSNLPTTALSPSAGGLGVGGAGTGAIQIDYLSVSQSGLSR